ncbi:hypothetical protein TI39_contig4195g00003 [Zymoseptoria brevis]|uniref:DUF7071 domain-containing protein n=1 Tax=Zymoseptoria brevis TaxID=1047168 RepID=A0A0F4GAS0_9PEZI|nr:hypothetical protein TI39_contig4195g00003 [Zymoseptoria brevis]
MARSDGDLVSIERSLGLKSDRGISRQGNKDSPVVQDLLSDIKVIAEQYVSKPNTEIRSSASLEKASLDLFSRYGPILWPDFGDDERPNWLETPSLEGYDGRYPKDLHYSDGPDRQTLTELFHDLVVEKCVKYHDNQLQKARRIARRSEKESTDQMQDDVHGQAQALPAFSTQSADVSIRNNAERFGSQPAEPHVPHGLPFGGSPSNLDDGDDSTTPEKGPDTRTKIQRLQDYREEMARMDQSFTVASADPSRAGVKRRRIDEHGPEAASKRARENGDALTPPQTSIDGNKQVHSESSAYPHAKEAPPVPGEKESQDVSATQRTVEAHATATAGVASSADPQADAAVIQLIDAFDNEEDTISVATAKSPAAPPNETSVPSAPSAMPAPHNTPLTHKSPSPPRRLSGFQAINAVNDAAQQGVPKQTPQRQSPATEQLDAVQRKESLPMQQRRMSLPTAAPPVNPVLNIFPGRRPQPTASPAPPLAIIPLTEAREERLSNGETLRPRPPAELGIRRPIPTEPTSTSALSPSSTAVSPRTVVRPLSHLPPLAVPSQRPHHLPSSPATQLYHFPSSSQPVSSSQNPQHLSQRPCTYPNQGRFIPQRPLANPRQVSSPPNLPFITSGLPSHGRRQSLAEEILGDLAKTPVVAQLMAANTDLDAQQLRNLRDKLTKYPEARVDINVLLARMSAPSDPPTPNNSSDTPQPSLATRQGGPPALVYSRRASSGTGHYYAPIPPPGPIPIPRPVPSNLMEPLPPKTHDLTQTSPQPFPNVTVELKWGLTTLDFNDYMELRDFSTTREFFALIDAHIPEEIARLGKKIKEIRVKSQKKDLGNEKLLPRIVRDEVRGRAAIRQLMKILRGVGREVEVELVFVIMWEDGRGGGK